MPQVSVASSNEIYEIWKLIFIYYKSWSDQICNLVLSTFY